MLRCGGGQGEGRRVGAAAAGASWHSGSGAGVEGSAALAPEHLTVSACAPASSASSSAAARAPQRRIVPAMGGVRARARRRAAAGGGRPAAGGRRRRPGPARCPALNGHRLPGLCAARAARVGGRAATRRGLKTRCGAQPSPTAPQILSRPRNSPRVRSSGGGSVRDAHAACRGGGSRPGACTGRAPQFQLGGRLRRLREAARGAGAHV